MRVCNAHDAYVNMIKKKWIAKGDWLKKKRYEKYLQNVIDARKSSFSTSPLYIFWFVSKSESSRYWYKNDLKITRAISVMQTSWILVNYVCTDVSRTEQDIPINIFILFFINECLSPFSDICYMTNTFYLLS